MKVGVVGLGTMGAGIAQVSVTAGHETVGREVTMELAERGRATIERYLGRAVEKERLTADERDAALARLHAHDRRRGPRGLRPGHRGDRRGARGRSGSCSRSSTAITRPDAVLATNTSALSVSEIAEATEQPERVVGMHFFNPAPVLPLVEIVRASGSSDEAVRTAYEWAERPASGR